LVSPLMLYCLSLYVLILTHIGLRFKKNEAFLEEKYRVLPGLFKNFGAVEGDVWKA